MKKLLGAGVIAGMLIAGAVTASPALAHTGDMNVTAVCNTQTGEYDFTVKLSTSNTGLAGQTNWRVGTASFQGTPSNSTGMDRGPVPSTGTQTITLGNFSLPGTTTGYGPWVYAFTKWSDGYGKGSDGQLLKQLKGDCKLPEPPFPGVEKYTPTYNVTCEAATFSHPEIKTGLGIANVYGIRYGATQAEAQAKDFTPYTPGTTVTYTFADKYIVNSYYFEVKVGFDGVTLKQQIGQTKGYSEACAKPVPPQPESLTGSESRDNAPVCVVPADGTATIQQEGRTWEQPYTFDEASWSWVLGEKVFTDWKSTSTTTVKLEKCNPEVVPPVDPPAEPPVDTPTPPKKIETAAASVALTGSSDAPIIALGGIALLAAGSLLIARRYAHK